MDYTTPRGQVRLLINDDTDTDNVFSDAAIDAFLALETGDIKRAAAQALDTIADDEALTSKVITSQDLSTNGAETAAGLRARATALREQSRAGVAGALTARSSFPTPAVYPG